MDKHIKFQHFTLTQTELAKIKHQTPLFFWMTGLSVAGKSTLANALDQQPLVYNVNKILNPDLIAVRDKNMKFIAEEKHEA
jgi:adenylylsulfate kinase-like enzyme